MKDTGAYAGAGSVAAVVVTHNRLAKLKETLRRLLDVPFRELAHVVVVDNASTDGTGEWLATLTDPRIDICHLDRNLGGAGGFAVGIRYATETCDPNWIVVMDDDARPVANTFAYFHGQKRDHREAWAAAVYYPSGELCEMNRPTRNPFWHMRDFLGALTRGRKGFHVHDDEFHGTDPLAIDAASFVGLFLSRKAIGLAGYPEASVFLYGDDVLYTLGLRRKGGLIDFDPLLHFEHDCNSTLPGRKIYNPIWRAYYHHRNLLLVYRRAAGPLFWPAVALIVPKWFTLARFYGDDAPQFRALLKCAIRDGLRRDTSRPHKDVLAIADDDEKHAA